MKKFYEKPQMIFLTKKAESIIAGSDIAGRVCEESTKSESFIAGSDIAGRVCASPQPFGPSKG